MSDKKPKKWMKKVNEESHGQSHYKAATSSIGGYVNEREGDASKTVAKSLTAMQHAHKTKSASNKSMRQSMYGKEKD